MLQPLVIREPQLYTGYCHLGSCREFIWEASATCDIGFNPSRFVIKGLRCVSHIDELMLRSDLFLHTSENREYLITDFQITDISNFDEIRGMASNCRILIEEFPEIKTPKGSEEVVIKKSTHLQAFRAVSALIGSVQSKPEIDARTANEVVNLLASEIMKAPNAVLNLLAIKSYDDYTFTHNINVATLSIFIGHAIGLSADELHALGTGALLHDLGKLKISQAILNKEGKLTNEEFVQIAKHPKLGVELVGRSKDIVPKSREVILQHHERFCGKGYPYGVSGSKISILARICAIADVFDALTTDRPYRPALTPYEAVKTLISLVDTYFDPTILQVFINKISLFPPGSLVELDDGRKAIVIRSNPGTILRPVVRALSHSKELGELIDLQKDTKHYIKRAILSSQESSLKK